MLKLLVILLPFLIACSSLFAQEPSSDSNGFRGQYSLGPKTLERDPITHSYNPRYLEFWWDAVPDGIGIALEFTSYNDYYNERSYVGVGPFGLLKLNDEVDAPALQEAGCTVTATYLRLTDKCVLEFRPTVERADESNHPRYTGRLDYEEIRFGWANSTTGLPPAPARTLFHVVGAYDVRLRLTTTATWEHTYSDYVEVVLTDEHRQKPTPRPYQGEDHTPTWTPRATPTPTPVPVPCLCPTPTPTPTPAPVPLTSLWELFNQHLELQKVYSYSNAEKGSWIYERDSESNTLLWLERGEPYIIFVTADVTVHGHNLSCRVHEGQSYCMNIVTW